MKIIEILRLQEMGFSQREIGDSIRCGKSTVGDIERRCKPCGLTYEAAQQMSEKEIKALIYPVECDGRDRKEPDWPDVHARLNKRDSNGHLTRINLQYLWEEYRQDDPHGISYSQYCRQYGAWKESVGLNVTMPINREPGKEMMVDWCGDTLDCVLDRETEKRKTAYFFVSTLGVSLYPYVEAFPDEKNDKWLTAHVHALKYYGGSDYCSRQYQECGYKVELL